MIFYDFLLRLLLKRLMCVCVCTKNSGLSRLTFVSSDRMVRRSASIGRVTLIGRVEQGKWV